MRTDTEEARLGMSTSPSRATLLQACQRQGASGGLSLTPTRGHKTQLAAGSFLFDFPTPACSVGHAGTQLQLRRPDEIGPSVERASNDGPYRVDGTRLESGAAPRCRPTDQYSNLPVGTLFLSGQLRRPCYLATTQRAAVPTAVRAADIANAVAMTLTHSQIDTVQFQPASLPHCTFLEPEPRR
jgi:hypothetical protein